MGRSYKRTSDSGDYERPFHEKSTKHPKRPGKKKDREIFERQLRHVDLESIEDIQDIILLNKG